MLQSTRDDLLQNAYVKEHRMRPDATEHRQCFFAERMLQSIGDLSVTMLCYRASIFESSA